MDTGRDEPGLIAGRAFGQVLLGYARRLVFSFGIALGVGWLNCTCLILCSPSIVCIMSTAHTVSKVEVWSPQTSISNIT